MKSLSGCNGVGLIVILMTGLTPHVDRFLEDKESVENKIIFAVKRHSGRNTVGRGGSFTREKHVFALLDW